MTQFTIPDEVNSAQGAAHTDIAEPKSRDFEELAQRDTGVVSGCLVTAQGTPNMTLAVASGVVRIAGVEAPAVSAGNVTITANSSGLPRYDLVVVNASGTKSVIAGTPASEVTLDDPAVDLAAFCVLAKVYVTSGATAITATEFADKRIPQNPNAFHDKSHTNADHSAAGTPSTQAFGDAAAAGASTSDAKSDHKHAMPALGTTAAAVGTSAGGSAVTPSKSDHVHATGAGTPSTQAMGDAAATGTGPAAAMTDHKHAMPALGTTAAAIGTSAGGSAVTPSKSDHVHATGAGTPSTQAFGDAAATGSGPAASMTDHKHAMPAGVLATGGGLESVVVGGNTGTAQTISIASGNCVTYTVNGNCTFTMPSGLTSGKLISFKVILTDSGGPRTITFTGVKWNAGADPTAMSAASAIDQYGFDTIDGGTTWYGYKLGTGFAT